MKTGSKTATRKKAKKRNPLRVAGVVKKKNIVVATPKRKKILKYDAIPCTQNGVTFYQTTVDIELLTMFICDIYDHKTGRGWNRNDEVEMRGENFCIFQTKPGSFCPVAIVINDRGHACNIKKVNGKMQIHFDTCQKVYVTEGQGRVHGFMQMHKQGISMDIPIIVTKGPLCTEIKTGWTINYKRKPVSTNMNLCQSSRIVQDFLSAGTRLKDIDRKLLLEAVSYEVVARMNNNKKSVFFKNFIMPNEKRQSIGQRREKVLKNVKDRTITHNLIKISAHSRTDHIQKIVAWALQTASYRNFNKLCNYVADIVMDFWKAMEEINPVIFNNPATIVYEDKKLGRREILLQGYHAQTRNGCFIMYPILIALLQKGALTKKDFKKYLSKSDIIKDVDFWKEDKEKRDGCQVLAYSAYSHTRIDILNEMGLGLK